MLSLMKNKLKKVSNLRLRGSEPGLPPYGYFELNSDWLTVKKSCSGYDAEAILKKVHQAILRVKNGTAVYERDSFLFDKIQYAWPLLGCLMFVAHKTGRIRVIDFGGSLGSTYFQNKKFLDEIHDVSWNVIEQKNFVRLGQQDVAGIHLRFFENIEASLIEKVSDVLVVSGSLQYLPDPWSMLDKFLSHDFEFIIFDRTTFNSEPKDLISKQVVPPVIYDASYPVWFLNKECFLKKMGQKYRLLEEWEALSQKIQICRPDGTHSTGSDCGFFFIKK